MIKSIAIDMDGTLLNKSQKVSKENREAIISAQNKGVEVVIATGRSFSEARYALDEADITCPIIGINGAVVMSEEGKVAASNPMNVEDVIAADRILSEKDLYYEIYTSEGTFSKDFDRSVATLVDIYLTANPDIDPLAVSEHARQRLELGHLKTIESYEKLFQEPNIEFYKLLVFSVDLKKLGEAASELKETVNLAVTSSGRENIEVNSMEAQKGIALEKYLEKKEIPLSEAMAIGDNYNDVSMFERVGRAVAMGNAPSDIQKLCDFVTDTNEENGVANAIWKVLKD
ncbi:Cof-type HAD-IIB family hydrolase [Bacillus sp. M6-12]|uniref:Cof-type HAD-IIB family hydrolase n=1 Tax=Bacillus sp. M6-12 TaxID=2054166 RepID=UPI000C77586A|nr:Cof-type HAD-IIB family hydrolase [Bacillus sp. M6-12]PLS18496.1 Cof-type HAD-IIB family hydrolase [Bacillus sp. M6-12]